MAHKGELEDKHNELIQEEIDNKVANLKTNIKVAPLSIEEIITNSTLNKIFGQEISLRSVTTRQRILA